MSYNEPVGVSILTNGARRLRLQSCISSFLASCYYRPLVIAILDNGSVDGTFAYLQTLPDTKPYGVEFRIKQLTADMGCAYGTNLSHQMVNDCKYALHLESDFFHLPPEISGIDRMWLHRALEFMETGECDYLYLRRMRSENEMAMHWWSQWMPKITEERGEYLNCPDFWWSNNPSLRRVQALYDSKTLPLDENKDGKKGEPGWSMPELKAPKPPHPWIHKWGVFIHEPGMIELAGLKSNRFGNVQCGELLGTSFCKYGFYIDQVNRHFCNVCNMEKGFRDMKEHDERWRK